MDGVHRVPVFLCSGGVVGVAGREDVCVVQFGAGAHEEIIGLGRIEDDIYRLRGGAPYGARRESGVLVGVIGRINLQMAEQYPFEFEIAYCIFDSGARLQMHAFVYAVQVEAGYQRQFVFVMALAFHYRCDNRHLYGGQPQCIGFGAALLVPEGPVFALHAAEQLFGSDVPIDLIRVRDKEAPAGLLVEPEGCQKNLVLQMAQQCHAVHQQVTCHPPCQFFACPHEMVPSDTHGCLVAVFEPFYQLSVAYLCRKTVETLFRFVQKQDSYVYPQVAFCADVVVLAQQVQHRVCRGAGIDGIAVRFAVTRQSIFSIRCAL